jgi:hypothetical protein
MSLAGWFGDVTRHGAVVPLSLMPQMLADATALTATSRTVRKMVLAMEMSERPRVLTIVQLTWRVERRITQTTPAGGKEIAGTGKGRRSGLELAWARLWWGGTVVGTL